MIAHPGEDRWLDFVNGLVTAEARDEMLRHARGCPACAEHLRESAAAFERARARATLQDWDGRRFANVLAPRRVRWLPIAAAAAVLVVAAGIGWRALHPPLALAPGALPAPDASIVTRTSGSANDVPALRRGLDAYRHGDYAGARRLLDAVRASGAAEDVRRLYAGSARLQTGDVRGALALLQSVDGSRVPEPWYGEWQWQLCVALASAGQSARADSLRRVIAERPGPVGDRARAWRSAPPVP